ncbi:pyridoxamine 5'-phosphate oxidase family protein [Pseudooceanicola batsensis HTCC2597]|uniref:Pyridoxamine 5'-phosphate oxidase family protein n=1 Tax=Pseudooceanicola batsensis (strain ATCC BAA-863 / DSM 15984 / KCTC 12145 / HTCC2597) TaxID=252305 RepID=A3TSW2_PSEBH|nr:pyridoxamine 5'-phosphate oxidase family protein [Pseudooceanicola batsensis]EAQ04739.1 pyridoxamine 5'-phosphate oxidase family protein [Pseudooceanicola batsensis HTCC2597]
MTITDIETLEAIYGDPVPRSITKVLDHLSPCYCRWIEASRFVILSTVGPEGTDASPRGDDGPVVRIADNRTVLLPDWMGNNRIDSLRNIVRDPRASLMFMVPGSRNVVRINGRAEVSADPELLASFDRGGKRPRTVVMVRVSEVYFQCAKALMRSDLWAGQDLSGTVPSAGDFVREVDAGFDGAAYDANYEVQAQPKLW